MIDYIKNYSEIFIYGIGIIGQCVEMKLKEIGVIPSGYIVSNNIDIDMVTFEIPIYRISQWCKKFDVRHSGIIVAVSTRNLTDVLFNLENENIRNYYVMNENIVWNNPVGVLDTTIGAVNHGNQIIMQAVRKNIEQCIINKFVLDLPCLDGFGDYSIEAVNKCDYIITGGTNLISGNIFEKGSIAINNENYKYFENKIVLLGAGYMDEDVDITEETKNIYRKIFSQNYYHSVRDEFTKQKLFEVGIKNVINTGCPTMWEITDTVCEQIPIKKSDSVLVMVTGGEKDRQISCIIPRHYKKIFAWVQCVSDYFLIRRLYPNAIIIGNTLGILDNFLENNTVDYVGTRLHGGIRCLQKGKRSIIMAIDHRAREMGKDFGLPVVVDTTELEQKICSPYFLKLKMPIASIRKWKGQFSRC